MIITISREFGSGGRELGKRLSDVLEISCYDKEIFQMIAERHGFDDQEVKLLCVYIKRKSDVDILWYPYRFFLLMVGCICHNRNKFFQKRAL